MLVVVVFVVRGIERKTTTVLVAWLTETIVIGKFLIAAKRQFE